MRLYHLPNGSFVQKENEFFKLVGVPSWDELINRDDLHAFLKNKDIHGEGLMLKKFSQSAWLRLGRRKSGQQCHLLLESFSPNGRIQRCRRGDFTAGSGAERPEIFFKATPGEWSDLGKAFGYGGIRLGMCLNRNSSVCPGVGQIVGYSVGNDVSSRSIEGENPLYLPKPRLLMIVPVRTLPLHSRASPGSKHGD